MLFFSKFQLILSIQNAILFAFFASDGNSCVTT